MCGIVGARDDRLRQRGLDPEQAVREAVDALRWRGPDGSACVRIGKWWLGCARLAITRAGSGQPVVRRGGRFAAVLNGAITNARELWEQFLPGAGRRPDPPNDAWLPLLAVERNRRDLLGHMRGHHAFAVVDAERDELVWGRDRHGEKPLWLWCGEDGSPQAFASTLPALEALGLPRPDLAAHVEPLLRFGFFELAPSHPTPGTLLLSAPPAEPTQSSGTTTGDLHDRLVDSVRRATDTSVATGLLLSGGIDSSCLAATLAEIDRRPPAFQFRAEGEPESERAIAREVASFCGLPFHPVDAGPEVLDALGPLTRCAGLPLGDPSVLAVHAVARAAAARGIRVLLGGEGADELFYGYRRYRALLLLPRLPWLRGTGPRWSMTEPARLWRAAVARDPAESLLEVAPPGFVDAVLAVSSGRPGEHGERPVPRSGRDLAAGARDSDLTGYLRHDLLPKADIATMAAGIESRCPYLEGDLAADATIGRDLGKRRLRAAFADRLPGSVFRQRKRGFSLPLDRWFRGDLPLLDLLRDRTTLERPHVSAAGIAEAIDRHRSGRCNLGHGLYLLAAIEVWLRNGSTNPPARGNRTAPPP